MCIWPLLSLLYFFSSEIGDCLRNTMVAGWMFNSLAFIFFIHIIVQAYDGKVGKLFNCISVLAYSWYHHMLSSILYRGHSHYYSFINIIFQSMTRINFLSLVILMSNGFLPLETLASAILGPAIISIEAIVRSFIRLAVGLCFGLYYLARAC